MLVRGVLDYTLVYKMAVRLHETSWCAYTKHAVVRYSVLVYGVLCEVCTGVHTHALCIQLYITVIIKT